MLRPLQRTPPLAPPASTLASGSSRSATLSKSSIVLRHADSVCMHTCTCTRCTHAQGTCMLTHAIGRPYTAWFRPRAEGDTATVWSPSGRRVFVHASAPSEPGNVRNMNAGAP
eukprot:363325-Chlamydomonas_euryale.AAC.7